MKDNGSVRGNACRTCRDLLVSARTQDPSFFKHLLHIIELVTLEEVTKKMDKVRFFHGDRQSVLTFEYEQVRELLRECVVWSKSKGQVQVPDKRFTTPEWYCKW